MRAVIAGAFWEEEEEQEEEQEGAFVHILRISGYLFRKR